MRDYVCAKALIAGEMKIKLKRLDAVNASERLASLLGRCCGFAPGRGEGREGVPCRRLRTATMFDTVTVPPVDTRVTTVPPTAPPTLPLTHPYHPPVPPPNANHRTDPPYLTHKYGPTVRFGLVPSPRIWLWRSQPKRYGGAVFVGQIRWSSTVHSMDKREKSVYLSEIEFSGLKPAKTSKTRFKKCFY